MRRWILLALIALAAWTPRGAVADQVRVKDLGRFLGWRDNALVGYGVVIGLSGSGDSPHNAVTQHALMNVLSRLGAAVPADDIQSRNVAAVIVTATLPAAASIGDRIDVAVSSIGDARSLVGGTLLMTPLLGPDQKVYALAQGQLVVGGYRFDSAFNLEQKNYPTSGVLPGGATVETPVSADLVGPGRRLTFILSDPDVITAERIKAAVDAVEGSGAAQVASASAVTVSTAGAGDLYGLIARIENLTVDPDALARVVVNERTGTVVSGGGVRISDVVVSQGDIRISVSMDNDNGAEPFFGGYGRHLVITNTKLVVSAPSEDAVVSFPSTTVADLVAGLARVHIDTRGMIAVLQAIKAAGALHAEIVVQ